MGENIDDAFQHTYRGSCHRTKVASVNTEKCAERPPPEEEMPNITVELLAGRTLDQRREFAKAVAESAVEILGARRQDVRMVFNEITPDIVANGGVLASEDESRAAVVAALADD
jgi:4-oxalocrotonate tautomerase